MFTAPEAAAAGAAASAHRPRAHGQRGVSLVELAVAIALAAAILGSLWTAWAWLTGLSADPLVARQTLAVAQSLLREIELQPIPGQAASVSAPGRSGYASILAYNGLALSGITDLEGNAITGLGNYGVQVSVSAQGLGGFGAGQGWWIDVVATGPGGARAEVAEWRANR